MQKLKKSAGMALLSSLAPALLFGVFALCSLMVILLGARLYNISSERMEDNSAARIGLSYISNKVRQQDYADSIEIERLGYVDALCLYQTINGEEYRTLIYWEDGYIRELFARTGLDIDLAAGLEIQPADWLSFKETDGGITVTLEYNAGKTASIFLAPRSEGNGAR